VPKAMKDVEIEDDAFKHIEAIIHSMTPIKESKPALIDVKRKARIAKGSGTKLSK
jgi:signal recognition particle subunit SRP54